MKIGRLLVRLVVGGLFIGHGTQKLFGWFGGPGPDGTEQMMYKIDMHPARRQALAAGLTETAGGALLAALLGLVDGGPGDLSADRALGIHDTGPAWALAALGLGAAVSALTIELGRSPGRDAQLKPDEEALDEAASREGVAAQASR